ncbi:AMP-dependent synthetase and ligase [Hyphomicrobium denitrificans 1NES1]|uniref:AMP-dependent synthetase and ligase n=1 Tax=Hyphomicrobium denitrificans 1NES1 TaxID=670307 RepID=N0BDI8_9HYPH|nr:AMP-binding protein [Hyphomicrobium denitrificans]AGK58541.1 AMP-dependent synthetase and ligase [Hyphomicrobium denitrificans 1NES1]
MGVLAAASELLELSTKLHKLIPPRAGDVDRTMELREQRFRHLLRYARDNSPFYRRRLQGIDLETCAIEDLPTLSKPEMMADLDNVFTDRTLRRSDIEAFISDHANLGVYYKGKYALCHTSGSQGQPALVVQDKHAIITSFAAQFARGNKVKRKFLPHLGRLVNPARMVIITQRPGFYPSSTFFNYFPRVARPYLKLQRMSVFDPIEEIVQRLNDFQPSFITGYTSSLEYLAREQEAGRLKLREGGKLEQMNSMSEPLPPAVAERIESAFGVHVTNSYSMAECMALSCGCPMCRGSHLNSDLAILEIVDANNQPVPNGTPGSKVLLTNLYNLIQPIIRYEIDDMVTMSARPCACGNLLPLIEFVGGRAKDRLWIEVDGQSRDLPIYVFLAALDNETNLAEHQILQTEINTFVLRAAAQPGKQLSAERLRSYINQSLAREGISDVVKLEVELVDRILPDKSGKVSRARNLYGPASDNAQPASGDSSRVTA